MLALLQQCEILIAQQVLDETSMEPGALEGNLPQNAAGREANAGLLEQLEEQLRDCEQREDYEQAAEIMEKINRIKDNGEQQ